MGEPVMADAQFGIVRTLRPYKGFEQDYEGQPANTPLMVTEGGAALDSLAAQKEPGYAPNLIRGLSVPLGARVLIWVPSNMFYSAGEGPLPYKWLFWWRYRSLADFRRARNPYHLSRQGEGVPDTNAPSGSQKRVVVPAATQTVIYNQPDPVTPLVRVAQTARFEDIQFGGVSLPNPLVPGGAEGAVQQGILDPSVESEATRPGWQIHELQAEADELLIGVFRDPDPATWDFETTDAALLPYLGSEAPRDVGVLVTVGSAP